MSEGRRSQVVLLDERRLDITIQSRLYAGELLDIVASHFNIKEKEYFGITFIDDTGQSTWLQLDKRVLEHDFPKKSLSQGTSLTFYFKIKYFVESITQLHDSATIEAFYLQAKSLVAKGELEIDSEITFQLAALVIQATYGDFIDELTFKTHLKRVPVLPTSSLKEYSSISLCENKVLEHYKCLLGQTRGDAIVNYLSILESLPTYGQHYYEVKDKSGNHCSLGLSYRGISQYDKNDRRFPKKVFLWKQLENLYFRDRKFTVEVHEARRVVHTLSSFNLYEDAIEEPVEEFDDLSSAICDPTTQVSVSRRALAPDSVTVYIWHAASSNIAKCIWSMAIAQHQFFLDRNHKKSRCGVVRSLSQIASELCRSVQSLSSASSVSNISRSNSNSSTSLPTIIIEGELSEESKAATIEMLTALQSRKDALQEALKKKTDELKAICLKEGELTGELPPETPFQPGEPQPQVRRRIGTSFTLSDKIICKAKGKDRETLNNLELDYEIQSKIASAAFKLANDVKARKSVRKLRKVSYQQATNKLKNIEEKLSTLKREKDAKKKSQDSISEGSVSEKRVSNHLRLPASSSENSIAERNLNSSLSSGVVPPSTSLPHLSESACNSAPPSPAKFRQRHQSLQHVPLITTEVYEDVPLPYSVQTRRNSSSYSAASEYDSVSCGGSSIASLGIPYRNRFEAGLNIEGTNHYSVPNRRASQAFNDLDELLDETASQCCPEDNLSKRYASASALSLSYDERMFHKGGEFTLVPESTVAVDCYDKSSISSNGLSCNDSSYQLPIHSDLSKRDKYIHSHSENSLHRQRANSLHHKLGQIHISEPELNLNSSRLESNISHAHNVPMLRNVLRPTSTILSPNVSEYCSGSTNQNMHQVAELVQASVLLQDSKRAAASGCLEHFSPKAKTKEWTETSLDSPVVTRKRKPKQSDSSPHSDHGQQAEWLDNGLPSNYPTDPYFGYQTQAKYIDDMNISSNSMGKFRKSPSPVQHQYSSAGCSDYRNLSPKVAYASQLPSERIYVNSSQLVSETSAYHHYENAAEISGNLGNFASQQSSCFESTHGNYNSNLNNTSLHDVTNTHQHLVAFEDMSSPKLGVAEPQQPSKHHNRKMNTGDIFPPETLPCINEPDYQNVPMDNQYEPIIYRDGSSSSASYTQAECDVPDSNHYHHNHSVYHDNFNNVVADSQQVQTWQSPVPSLSIDERALSPVSQNFSPNVEVNVVSVGHYQPYWEETKPYELSDFYKYSTKHRKQQKMNSSVSSESQAYVEKDSSEISHQYCEQTHRENANVQCRESTNIQYKENTIVHYKENVSIQYREHHYPNDAMHASNIASPVNQHQEFVTSHVPVFDSSAQLESPAKYYAETSISSPPQPSDPNKSLSFGEDLRISLADTFHDEMVAWYQNQDTVKKATLV